MSKIKALIIILAIPLLFSCTNQITNEDEKGDYMVQVVLYPFSGSSGTYHVRLLPTGKIITSVGERGSEDIEEVTNLEFSLISTRKEEEAFLSEYQFNELMDAINSITIDDLQERGFADGVSHIDIIYDGNIYRYMYEEYIDFKAGDIYDEFYEYVGLKPPYFNPHIVMLLDKIFEYSPITINLN